MIHSKLTSSLASDVRSSRTMNELVPVGNGAAHSSATIGFISSSTSYPASSAPRSIMSATTSSMAICIAEFSREATDSPSQPSNTPILNVNANAMKKAIPPATNATSVPEIRCCGVRATAARRAEALRRAVAACSRAGGRSPAVTSAYAPVIQLVTRIRGCATIGGGGAAPVRRTVDDGAGFEAAGSIGPSASINSTLGPLIEGSCAGVTNQGSVDDATHRRSSSISRADSYLCA